MSQKVGTNKKHNKSKDVNVNIKAVIAFVLLIVLGLILNFVLFSYLGGFNIGHSSKEIILLGVVIIIILGIDLYLLSVINDAFVKFRYPWPLAFNIVILCTIFISILLVPHINMFQLHFYLNRNNYIELAQKIMTGDFNKSVIFPVSLEGKVIWDNGNLATPARYRFLSSSSIDIDFAGTHGQEPIAIYFRASDSVVGRHALEEIVYDSDDQLKPGACINSLKLDSNWYFCSNSSRF